MKWENKLRVYFLFRERGKRVSCSSTEAEYRALATIAAKLAWLRLLLKSFTYFFHMCLCFGVTMCFPLPYLLTLCFTLDQNILRSTYIMLVKKFCARINVLNLFLVKAIWLMCLWSLWQLLYFFFSDANSWWSLPPLVWGGMLKLRRNLRVVRRRRRCLMMSFD